MKKFRNSKLEIRNSRNGFTLVELLVVISIIGILTVIGVVSFSSAQKKARDVARKSELSALSKALMMYYSDKGVFPDSTFGFGVGLTDGTYVYMKKTPAETRITQGMPGFCYVVTNDLKSFGLFASLENTEDAACKVNGVGVSYVFSGTCSTTSNKYCYAITSPNTDATTMNVNVGVTKVAQQ